jgi:hypothetical protein
MPELREFCENALQELAAPTFSLSAYDALPSTTYFWKIIKRGEMPEQVGMIPLTAPEYLYMSTLSDSQKRQYLRDRFGLYFDQLHRGSGLGQSA